MKKIYIVIGLLLFCFSVPGQNMRHVKGVNMFGLTYGISKDTKLYGISLTSYMRRNLMWNATAWYESGREGSTKIDNYLLNAGVDYTPFVLVNNVLFFNIGASVNFGFETLKSNESTDTKNKFTFGPSINTNLECYITSRLVAQIKAEQFYTPMSNLGNWVFVYSLGLKFCMY